MKKIILSSSEMAKLLNYKDRKSFGSAKTIYLIN